MIVESSSGDRFTLGEAFNRGGEAQIWSLRNETHWVAKLYHQPTPHQEAKVATMIAAPPKQLTGHPTVAWPLQMLYQQRRFVGYLMPRVVEGRPLFHYYNGLRRAQLPERYPWPYFLHRTAQNLAAAVDLVHTHYHIIGDLNESNVLVNPEALVTLVDTDSFQVRAANQVALPQLTMGQRKPMQTTALLYRSTVGKAEFTPPELQGVDFKSVDRSAEHDNFALGVLIFYLLMDGFHPFAGVLTTPASVGRVDLYAMRQGLFPYQFNRQIHPPPGAPTFGWLTPTLQEAFRRCFVTGHSNPQLRPAAHEWRQLLEEAENKLTCCDGQTKHVYADHLPACPYCALAAQPRVAAKARQPVTRKRSALSPRPRPPLVANPTTGSMTTLLHGSALHLPQNAAEWQQLLQQWGQQSQAAATVAWHWSNQHAHQQWVTIRQQQQTLQQTLPLLPERLQQMGRTAQRFAPLWQQWVAGNLLAMIVTALLVGVSSWQQRWLATLPIFTPQLHLISLGVLGGLLLGGAQAWVLRTQLLPWSYLRALWVLMTGIAGLLGGAAAFALIGDQWQQGNLWLAAPLTTTLLGAIFGTAASFLQAQLLRQQLQLAGDGRLWTLVNGVCWALASQGALWGVAWQGAQAIDARLGPLAGLVGGLLVSGAITGAALVWMLQGPRRLFLWQQILLKFLSWHTLGRRLRRQSLAWGRAALFLVAVVVTLSWWQVRGGEVTAWQALLAEWSTHVGWP